MLVVVVVVAAALAAAVAAAVAADLAVAGRAQGTGSLAKAAACRSVAGADDGSYTVGRLGPRRCFRGENASLLRLLLLALPLPLGLLLLLQTTATTSCRLQQRTLRKTTVNSKRPGHRTEITRIYRKIIPQLIPRSCNPDKPTSPWSSSYIE